jgi:hypothetical protein
MVKNEYYVYFSKDTIRKAMELFFKNGYQSNATIEHEYDVDGTTVVESWIIEDDKLDKSRAYGLELPVGTWMVSMKIDNESIWNRVKEGEFKGFSIEGYFVDKLNMSSQSFTDKDEITMLTAIVLAATDESSFVKWAKRKVQ